MRFLSVAGTVAMFLVGGNILMHGIPSFAHWIEPIISSTNALSTLAISSLFNILLGIMCGGLILGITRVIQKIKS
jgi:predicted DNA repair protein MutK